MSTLLFRLLSGGRSVQIIDEGILLSPITMTILTNRLSVLSELGISASAGSSLGSLGNISDIYSPSLSISDSINNTTNLLTEISFVSSSEIILLILLS